MLAAIRKAGDLHDQELYAARAAAAQELRDLIKQVRCHADGSVTAWTGEWGFRIHVAGDEARIGGGVDTAPGEVMALQRETREGVVAQPFLPPLGTTWDRRFTRAPLRLSAPRPVARRTLAPFHPRPGILLPGDAGAETDAMARKPTQRRPKGRFRAANAWKRMLPPGPPVEQPSDRRVYGATIRYTRGARNAIGTNEPLD